MWNYEKRLQYPVNIKEPNAKLAQVIISQFGGPDGELAASMRYLSQRYSMPYKDVSGLLTDIGTEELGHLEIIGAIIYQLTKNLSMEEIQKSGFDKYYVDHTIGVWPQAAGGIPFNACEFQVKGDIIRRYGGGAEGTFHLRQYPQADKGCGCVRTHKIFESERSCSLSEVWRGASSHY